MIFTFHKISFMRTDSITCNLFGFIKQMFVLSKYKVVYLRDYNPNDKNQAVIRFDDGCKSLLKYAVPILKIFGYPFELFIVADFIAEGEKGNKGFLNKKELMQIVNKNGRLQYHSKSHVKLTEISDYEKLKAEIICPTEIKELDNNGFEYFAYPYWVYNDKITAIVKEYYKGALSGNGYSMGGQYSLDSVAC